MVLTACQKFLNTAQIKNFYNEKPAGLKWRSNTIFILSTVAIGIFTDLFLYSLVVPILPFLLDERIGIPQSQIQSYTSGLLTVYAGSSVIFSPVAGVLADRVETRQAPFLFALSMLIISTIILFLGTTIPVLFAARVLQGVSSAFVWTVGLAICIETVGPKNLGKAIGSIFSFVSAGSLWAPFLGGVLYEKTGYIGVLGLAVGVLAIDLLMRILVIEKKVAKKYKSADEDDENTANGDANDQNDQSRQEPNEEQPLLDGQREQEEIEAEFKLPAEKSKTIRLFPILPCLKNKSLLTALLLAAVQAIVLGSVDATVATHSQDLFGFNSLQAGILFLPLGLCDLIFGPIFGWGVDRYGTKPVAVLSFTLLVPVFISLRIPHEGGLDQIIIYGVLLGLSGISLSGTGAPSIVEAGAVVEKYHKANTDFFGESGPYAQLYGMNSMMYNLGLTVGPELAGELKDTVGYGNMNLIMAAICAVTAVISYLYLGGKPKMLQRKES